MNDPSEPLAHGAMILFSGALLLTPGFFTDFIGFLLLIPNVRATVFQKVKERINIQKRILKRSFHRLKTYTRASMSLCQIPKIHLGPMSPNRRIEASKR